MTNPTEQRHIPDPAFPVPVLPIEVLARLANNSQQNIHFNLVIPQHLPYDIEFQLLRHGTHDTAKILLALWDQSTHAVREFLPIEQIQAVANLELQVSEFENQKALARSTLRQNLPQLGSITRAIMGINNLNPDEIDSNTYDLVYGPGGLFEQYNTFIQSHGLAVEAQPELTQASSTVVQEFVASSTVQAPLKQEKNRKTRNIEIPPAAMRYQALEELIELKLQNPETDEFGYTHDFINNDVIKTGVDIYRTYLEKIQQSKKGLALTRAVDSFRIMLYSDLQTIIILFQRKGYQVQRTEERINSDTWYARYNPAKGSKQVRKMIRFKKIEEPEAPEPELDEHQDQMPTEPASETQLNTNISPALGKTTKEQPSPEPAIDEVSIELGLDAVEKEMLKMLTVLNDYPLTVERVLLEIYYEQFDVYRIRLLDGENVVDVVSDYKNLYREVETKLNIFIEKARRKFKVSSVTDLDAEEDLLFYSAAEYSIDPDEKEYTRMLLLGNEGLEKNLHGFVLSIEEEKYAQADADKDEYGDQQNYEIYLDSLTVYEVPLLGKIILAPSVKAQIRSIFPKYEDAMTVQTRSLLNKLKNGIAQIKKLGDKPNLYRIRADRMRLILYKNKGCFFIVAAERRLEDSYKHANIENWTSLGRVLESDYLTDTQTNTNGK